MSRTSSQPFRFRPPAHRATAEERWCLLRAFAPREAPGPFIDATAAVDVARALALGSRIVGRLGPTALQAELGEEGARALMHDYASALGQAQTLARAAKTVAEAAVEARTPLALLKRAALVALGLVDDAQREAADVDVLVDEDRLPALEVALVARGFRPSEAAPADHQAAPLTDASGAMIELHRFVPGLQALGSRRDARFADLEGAGGLAALAGWPGRVFTPTREVLAAHVLVHGLDQHGLAPGSYPLTRMLADLADLEQRGYVATPDVVQRWSAAVSPPETAAALQLVADLRRGAPPSSPHASALLGHILVAASDPGYHASLGQRALLAQLRSGVPGDRRRLFASVVFPTRAQLEAIYGGPRGRLGYALLRLWRPFDLGLRLARHLLRG